MGLPGRGEGTWQSLEVGMVPLRSLLAAGVLGVLLALVTWVVVYLVSRHRYKLLATAGIVALSVDRLGHGDLARLLGLRAAIEGI